MNLKGDKHNLKINIEIILFRNMYRITLFTRQPYVYS